ncbi:AIR synthase-related protein [Methanococcus maripaludis]|uniref:Phosphoribosylformylglycinamidine cyclo-ligase n=1 Tax=Methanococcus maripaludis TaxID=39152 RepID=A0A7J9PB74_METMI|nr:AIR synthase-related protein [Methanococcus maripaludis]MBA2860054.1 phosphoribosylformylglycinamidine cyclo-ligase [Methanococcus maripaludis]
MENIEYEINYAIEHMMENNYPRKEFWGMDSKVPGLSCGIRAGDDGVVIGKSVYNMEGPYPLILGSKTALIHTTCDIVAMGAKPLYAMDAIQAANEEEIEIAIDGLKKQSIGLDIPIIGGNTQTIESLKSCMSVVVFGELISDKIIRDSGSKDNDVMLMLGHPVEGDIGERVQKAKNKFDTFLDVLKNDIEVHACKDASRGGWLCNILEMLLKAQNGVEITGLPYPRATRYLGTYLVSVPEDEVSNILEIAVKHRCPLTPFGRVTSEKVLKIGNNEYINNEKMNELIKNFPYKY